MNDKNKKLLEQNYDTISGPELMMIMGTQILLLSEHSRKFVDDQKNIIGKLDVRKVVKDICISILDEVKIKDGEEICK